MTADEAVRYVIAEDVETGTTRCFAKLSPDVERYKVPGSRRKFNVYYYPKRYFSGKGMPDMRGLLESPFWTNPRIVAINEIPDGVTIP